ncbi:MAG: DNA adenine methylase [Treponema sp.]
MLYHHKGVILVGKMHVTKINNRRYLGNKYRLLQFINDVVAKECGKFETFADIFAGTGTVSSYYRQNPLYKRYFIQQLSLSPYLIL